MSKSCPIKCEALGQISSTANAHREGKKRERGKGKGEGRGEKGKGGRKRQGKGKEEKKDGREGGEARHGVGWKRN